MFLRYLKNSVWNFLLCCIMSWSLAQMCFLGFYIRPEQQNDVGMLIAIVVIVTAVLWLVSFGKKTIIGGVIGFIAAAVAAFLYLRMNGEVMRAFTDSKDSSNPYLYFMVCFAVIIGVWLLASTRRGTLVLLILGILVEAVIHFLYHNNQLLWLVLFLICCITNLAVQNYWLNIADTKGAKTSFGSTAAVACICTIVIALVGGALFYGIVQPISPPTKKLYLLEKDMKNTLVDRMGLAKPLKRLDPDLITEETEENQEEQSQHNRDNRKGSGEGTEESAPQDNAITQLANDAKDAVLDAISYPLPKDHWWLPLLIIAIIIAAAIVLKILSRRWWFVSVQKRPRKEQISKIYHLFLWKFRVIKEGKNKEETPYEYAERCEEKLASFAVPEAGFAELTDIFVHAGYSEEEVSEEDYNRYVAFYRKMPGKLRQYLGLRYVIKFFLL